MHSSTKLKRFLAERILERDRGRTRGLLFSLSSADLASADFLDLFKSNNEDSVARNSRLFHIRKRILLILNHFLCSTLLAVASRFLPLLLLLLLFDTASRGYLKTLHTDLQHQEIMKEGKLF